MLLEHLIGKIYAAAGQKLPRKRKPQNRNDYHTLAFSMVDVSWGPAGTIVLTHGGHGLMEKRQLRLSPSKTRGMVCVSGSERFHEPDFEVAGDTRLTELTQMCRQLNYDGTLTAFLMFVDGEPRWRNFFTFLSAHAALDAA